MARYFKNLTTTVKGGRFEIPKSTEFRNVFLCGSTFILATETFGDVTETLPVDLKVVLSDVYVPHSAVYIGSCVDRNTVYYLYYTTVGTVDRGGDGGNKEDFGILDTAGETNAGGMVEL